MAERVGRYRLEEVIGVGSFATVHRAVDEHLDDVVVVKILAENHSLNPEVRERFIAEGRSLRRVVSPHVVTIHDIGESERQQPYLVLEYADRGTLAGRVAALRARGWVPSRDDVLRTARSLAAAIEAVHRANLVHRDLSPGNVLLTSKPATRTGADSATGSAGGAIDGAAAVVRAQERLVVADLGMCKDLAMNSGLTVAGGTSGFRPPEQDGPGLIDTRADLWAMSTLLLWMCPGDRTDLPEALFAALRRSTADDPDRRHPDVAAWLADIEEALAPPPVAAPPEPTDERSASARAASPAAAVRSAGPSAASARARDAQAHPARPPRRWRAALIVALAVVLTSAAAFLGGVQVGSQAPERSGEYALAIDGPDQIRVGQDVTFSALTQGVDSWVWTLPTGAHVLAEPSVTITARSPGTARVVLRARTPDGTDLEVVHHLSVTE